MDFFKRLRSERKKNYDLVTTTAANNTTERAFNITCLIYISLDVVLCLEMYVNNTSDDARFPCKPSNVVGRHNALDNGMINSTAEFMCPLAGWSVTKLTLNSLQPLQLLCW